MARKSGQKNHAKPINTVDASRCPQCGSTERTPYDKRRVNKIAGERDGHIYNEIVYRSTCCLSCGQWRIDRSFNFVPVPKQVE